MAHRKVSNDDVRLFCMNSSSKIGLFAIINYISLQSATMNNEVKTTENPTDKYNAFALFELASKRIVELNNQTTEYLRR